MLASMRRSEGRTSKSIQPLLAGPDSTSTIDIERWNTQNSRPFIDEFSTPRFHSGVENECLNEHP